MNIYQWATLQVIPVVPTLEFILRNKDQSFLCLLPKLITSSSALLIFFINCVAFCLLLFRGLLKSGHPAVDYQGLCLHLCLLQVPKKGKRLLSCVCLTANCCLGDKHVSQGISSRGLWNNSQSSGPDRARSRNLCGSSSHCSIKGWCLQITVTKGGLSCQYLLTYLSEYLYQLMLKSY